MNNDKVNEALEHYAVLLGNRGAQPKRLLPEERAAVVEKVDARMQDHLLWMAFEAARWPAEKLDKKFRWLGFVQGALWAMGLESIEDAKSVNKPTDEPMRDSP